MPKATAGSIINAYLLFHLSKEIPGLDVWRQNVVRARATGKNGKTRYISAGEAGQADLGGLYAPSGRMVQVEGKGPNDPLSDEQIDFRYRIEKGGGVYIVCKIKDRAAIEQMRPASALKVGFIHPPEMVEFLAELRARLERK